MDYFKVEFFRSFGIKLNFTDTAFAMVEQSLTGNLQSGGNRQQPTGIVRTNANDTI